jgi:hypothetical protein
MLFAAAALFSGAHDSAFAHDNHFHSAQTQSAGITHIEAASAAVIGDCGSHAEDFVSTADLQKQQCRHGHTQSDCDSCCACAASASVAIATSYVISGATRVRSEAIPLASAYHIRQAVLDLSRPPKSFA